MDVNKSSSSSSERPETREECSGEAAQNEEETDDVDHHQKDTGVTAASSLPNNDVTEKVGAHSREVSGVQSREFASRESSTRKSVDAFKKAVIAEEISLMEGLCSVAPKSKSDSDAAHAALSLSEESQPGAYALNTVPPAFRLSNRQYGTRSGTALISSSQDGPSSINENIGDPASGLVQANLVNDEATFANLEEARPMHQTRENKRCIENEQQRRFLIFLALLLVLSVLIVLGVVIAFANDNETDKSVMGFDEGFAGSTSPVTPPLSQLEDALPAYTLNVIYDDVNSTSPQAQAFRWIEQDPMLDSYAVERLVQRFAMATFYYATQGDGWTERGGGSSEIFHFNRSIAAEVKRFLSPEILRPPPGKEHRQLQGSIAYVTSEEWMTYNTHECDWFSASVLDGLPACDEDGRLEWFNLRNNNLVGSLTEEIGLLSNLKGLQLWKNHMEGFVPSQIGALTRMEVLDIDSCEHLKGTIPREIGLLSNSLKHFVAMDNDLTGPLPEELWKLSQIELIRLDRNDFTGTVPYDLGSRMPHLKLFMIALTKMSGTIPTSVGLLSDLIFYDAFKCSYISGTLPSEFGILSSLTRIFLHGNKLMGTLPTELANIPNLYEVKLFDNPGLTGTIPVEFGSELVEKLKTLNLEGTNIEGAIPEQLCNIEALSFTCSELLCGCDCSCATNRSSLPP